MNSRSMMAAGLIALAAGFGVPAFAGAGDYAFELVQSEIKKGDDATVAVRLVNKTTHQPVTDAVIIRTRMDMAPDGMAEMTTRVAPASASTPGVYTFKTDLSMAGRWQFTLAAKVQGETETVTGKLILQAAK